MNSGTADALAKNRLGSKQRLLNEAIRIPVVLMTSTGYIHDRAWHEAGTIGFLPKLSGRKTFYPRPPLPCGLA